MTILAFKDGILAADKMAVHSDRAITVTKIFRWHNWLLGVSGDYVKGLEMIEWFKSGRVPSGLPSFQRTNDFAPLLAIGPEGILRYEDSVAPMRVEEKTFAVGSGRDYAIAAMHLGLSAVDAVRVASELCNSCGNGIDWLEVGA